MILEYYPRNGKYVSSLFPRKFNIRHICSGSKLRITADSPNDRSAGTNYSTPFVPSFPFAILPNTFAADRDKGGTTNFLDSGGPFRRENFSFVQSHYIPIFHVACGRVGGGCRTESQGVAKIPFQYFTAYVLSLLAELGVVNTYAKQTALRRSSMLLGFHGGCKTTYRRLWYPLLRIPRKFVSKPHKQRP